MKCQLCDREVENIEFHHFFPGKKRRKNDDGIFVCLTCGDQLHLLFTNTELRTQYNSLEAIKKADRVLKYIEWIKDKPEKLYTMKMKKRKP